jgi:hypothetical protein
MTNRGAFGVMFLMKSIFPINVAADGNGGAVV